MSHLNIHPIFENNYDIKNNKNYLLSTVNSLDNFRKNILLSYLLNKNIIKHDDLKNINKHDDLKNINDIGNIITTPHPIGNLNIEQSILIDSIVIIDKILLRYNVYNEKKPQTDKYSKQYLNKKLTDIKELFKSLESIAQNYYFKNYNFELIDSLEKLQKLFIDKFLNYDLSIKVISKEEESLSSDIKLYYYQRSLPENFNKLTKSWNGIDADGDKNNPMNNLSKKLHEVDLKDMDLLNIVENLTQKYIINNSLENNKEKFQPRISYDEEKKGGYGIEYHLKKFVFLNDIKGLDDILEEKKFNITYNQFVEFFREEKYQDVNSHLDFLLRVAPELISGRNRSGGLVISDYTNCENAHHSLYKLTFLKKAIFRFIQEQNKDIDLSNINESSFLILCENQESINNSKKIFEQIFTEIINYVKNPEVFNEKEIKNLFFPNGNFIFGSFYGPSDLTKDMGGMADLTMHNASIEIQQIWETFKKNIDIQDVNFIREYGQGTSFRRGVGLALDLPKAYRTSQGINPIAINSTRDKNYGLLERKMRNGVAKRLDIAQELINLSSKNHRYFWEDSKENPGLIPQEYNNLINSNKLWKVLDRNYLNNQGTRGSDGLFNYSTNRAISAASIATFTGLIPLISFSSESKFWDKFDLKDFISHPVGLYTLVREFYGFIITDCERAQLLGFSKDLIAETTDYINICFDRTEQALELNNQENSIANRIKNILNHLIIKQLIKNEFMNHYIKEFLVQIDLYISNSQNLTSLIKEVSINNDKMNNNYLSNIALNLNLLTNPILPIIPASIINVDLKKDNFVLYNIHENQNLILIQY